MGTDSNRVYFQEQEGLRELFDLLTESDYLQYYLYVGGLSIYLFHFTAMINSILTPNIVKF